MNDLEQAAVVQVTSSTEFTAAIRSDDPAYLNWEPSPTVEHANISSIRDLITCPFRPSGACFGRRSSMGLRMTSFVFISVTFARTVSTETPAARAVQLLYHVFGCAWATAHA